MFLLILELLNTLDIPSSQLKVFSLADFLFAKLLLTMIIIINTLRVIENDSQY